MAKIPKSTSHGFTLVELLVVISIIVLLIAILLPSLKRAREQARTVKGLSNLRTMSLGVDYYSDDHAQLLPGPIHPPIFRSTGIDNPPFSEMNPDTERPWFLLARIAPYFSQHDTFLEFADAVATCPTAQRINSDENFIPNVNGNPSWSRPYHYLPNTWSNTGPSFYFGWVNIGSTWTGFEHGFAAMEPNSDQDPFLQSGSFHKPKIRDRIARASEEWMIGDAWWDLRVTRPTPFSPPKSVPLGTWQLRSLDADSSGMSHNPLPRKPIHLGGTATNLVFFDGHGETFSGIDEWAKQFPANPNPKDKPDP